MYSFRYRRELPFEILKTAEFGFEWIIEGAGRAEYKFKLVKVNRIIPNDSLMSIKIPDSTPELIRIHSLSDEQALLAVVRYNRLIDIFLGLTTYSLQNHLRTTVKQIGQIEIDEIYVGIDRNGTQFVLPVQAKGGSDQLSVVQTKQDIECCKEKFPQLVCRAISAQFISNDHVALFELAVDDDMVKVLDERHYKLVSASEIDPTDLERYRHLSRF
ncbi:MAG: endonuclease [Rhodospirillaceae bacterium]|nr:endonuclease [Rhodospirillales bacterium]MAX49195.1 endonuclease [Rhodospirillaceae bacterium]